jgi:hypothetical protein
VTARLLEQRDGLPTIDLSPGAAASGADAATVGQQAAETIADQGCVRLIRAFDPALMAALKAAHDRRYRRYFPQRDYADARNQGHRRTLITLEVEGAFHTPAFYANPYVIATARRVLGANCILGHLATILSRPGSEDQSVHRDTPSLFGDDRYDAIAPATGIAMVLPFATLDGRNGGTRVWPTSQNVVDFEQAKRMPSVVAQLPVGSCLLFDVRAVHGGVGNGSDEMRSIGYFAYHRHWFRDWDGFDRQPPLSISRRALKRVPPEYRHLFEWSFDRHARQRPRMALRRLASRLVLPAVEWARGGALRAR